MPEEVKIVRDYACDRCGRTVAAPPPREFIPLKEMLPHKYRTKKWPQDYMWRPRVHFEYVLPSGFVANTATTCWTCRAALLEEALDLAQQEAAKEQENVPGN